MNESIELERLIREVYRVWKSGQPSGGHPGEEEFASFIDGTLEQNDSTRMKEHLVSCPSCASLLSLHVKLMNSPDSEPPERVVKEVMEKILPSASGGPLEIVLKAKDKLLEILSTTGDALLGQELVPGAVLRGREPVFRDEIRILKDFDDVRIEVKVENTGSDFRVAVRGRNRQGALVRDIRISLFREGRELESYMCDEGFACFEHVMLGRYSIEVVSGRKLSSITLDIRR